MATLARHFNPAGACRAATQRIATSAAAATTRPLHGGLFPRPRRQPARPTPLPIHPASSPQPAAASAALFSHTAAPGAAAARRGRVGHNNEPVPDQAPETDFSRMDMLGSVPVPATSVDICMWDGFALNSGTKILDGSGALLVAGEAFAWRPWGARKRLLNARGQWEVDPAALGILSLVWPRPDLLLLGLGPEIRPLSPETKKYISSLGIRVEVLDTRNAASQFNMLATERGVGDVAAALIPIGWREGVGVV